MSNSRRAAAVKVLIVEDYKPSRLGLMKLVKDMGFAVSGCETVAQAREHLKNPPDILILDLMLPDGNGTEILKEVRQQKAAMKVAVVSGAADAMLMEASKLGPDALFGKPIDLADFKDWLTKQTSQISPVAGGKRAKLDAKT